jgi:hypothetical protein
MSSVKQYRKKPGIIVIEAMRYDGLKNGAEVRRWLERNGVNPRYTVDYKTFQILTPEGSLNISSGDYVIRGVKGEFYPCKPDIFEATYEEVQ